VARDRKLAIVYCKPNGQRSERTVDPLGLVAKGIVWYLVANTAAGMRTFRVSRIEKATLLPKVCKRPRDFNLAAHWASTTRQLAETRTHFTATFRLQAKTAKWLMEWHHGKELGEPNADGRVAVSLDFDNEDQARFVALGLGSRVEVLEPESLKSSVVEEAKRVASS
jgi:predicted DNA-binding transcriptional regulator YafY